MKKSIAILGIALVALALSTTVAKAGVITDKVMYSKGEIVSITCEAGIYPTTPPPIYQPHNPIVRYIIPQYPYRSTNPQD